jgi:hypothetical protein
MGGRSNEGTGGAARAGRDKEQAEAIIMGFSFSIFEIIRFLFSFCFLESLFGGFSWWVRGKVV